jgi:small conductance mechanosensitive channel
MVLKYSSRIFCLIPVFLIAWFVAAAYGLEEQTSKNREVSTRELEEVVTLLEDPQKRDALLKELKTLLQAQALTSKPSVVEAQKPKEDKKRELLAIEQLFSHFTSFSEDIILAAKATGALVMRTPDALEYAKDFFSQPQNRRDLIKLLGGTAGAVLIAMIFWLFLRGHVQSVTEKRKSLSARLVGGLYLVILSALPFAVLILSLFFLFKTLPSFPFGHSVALLLAVVISIYRIAMETVRILLSPENKETRVLPLDDEGANYFWLWALRFGKYAAFYFFIMNMLSMTNLSPPSFSFLRGVLLILFPLMISVFLLQLSREFLLRKAVQPNNGKSTEQNLNKFFGIIRRYWALPAIAYTWGVFLLPLLRHEKGFRYLATATLGTLITLLLVVFALRILSWLDQKLFAINDLVKVRFPGLEGKTNRYLRVIKKFMATIVVIIGFGVACAVWGIPIARLVASETGSLVILRALAVLLTAGIALAVMEISDFSRGYLLRKKGERPVTQKMETLIPMITSAVKIAVAFVGGVVILGLLGVNTTPILAGAGIVGLAVGFGSQTLVKDLINGLFILFEESIRVGDWASLDGKSGLVETVGLRTVKLRDLHGNVHVIPNSSINTLTNLTKEFSRTVLDVGVAYREDVDEVIGILRQIGEEMREDPAYQADILEPLEVFGLDRFEDSAIIIRARFKTRPLKQWGIKREFNRRMKRIFDERGIEIPFPHRTIYMGEPKEGAAAPLHLEIDKEKSL